LSVITRVIFSMSLQNVWVLWSCMVYAIIVSYLTVNLWLLQFRLEWIWVIVVEIGILLLCRLKCRWMLRNWVCNWRINCLIRWILSLILIGCWNLIESNKFALINDLIFLSRFRSWSYYYELRLRHLWWWFSCTMGSLENKIKKGLSMSKYADLYVSRKLNKFFFFEFKIKTW